MYSGWISDRETIENECGEESVLNNFPSNVGRDVAAAIIKNLMPQRSEKKELFKSEKDLEWTMNVICYGLTMPLQENQQQHQVEIIKNCVYLYVDWTSVMSKKPNAGIPSQIFLNKEFYFAKMLKHLANLFIPRESTSATFQEKFCKHILFHLKNIVEEGSLSKNASENILKFYLGVSGHLLSAPIVHELANLLCEQLIHSLITVWLHVSCQHFPSPTLWCTLRDMLLSWRHHPILIVQWNKLMYVLTCRVLLILFGPQYPLPQLYRDDSSEPIILPNGMSNDIAVQCWFRFLHSIGNPVDLTDVRKICQMRNGVEHGKSSTKSLPKSFFEAMQGVSVLVNMFLRSSPTALRTASMNPQPFLRGEWKSASTGTMEIHSAALYGSKPATVPGVRRIADPLLPTKTVRDDSNISPKTLNAISADANCILHLFGAWLFDVCLAGFHIEQVLDAVGVVSCGKRLKSLNLSKEEEEIGVKFPQVKKNEFEPGTAQSFSILCRIFCHQPSAGQAILPVYLSRFYLTLAVGLCYGETRAGQVLGDILLNATDILRIDLHGVQVLVPHILQALEIILPNTAKDISLGYNISVVDLRRSCIQILLSMICLPLHFLQLPIQGLCKERTTLGDTQHQVTFISLKGRLTTLLQKALEAERDSENTQLLLAGAMLLMEDTMLVEIKNYEFSKKNPGSVAPCILLESIDDMNKGSPKLIHIAKPLKPAKIDIQQPQQQQQQQQQPQQQQQQQQKPAEKGEIGCLGNKNDPKTTKGLFVYMTKFLCQRLMFADKGEEHVCWRGDLNITLAALECISGMSHFDSKFIDEDEAKTTLKWICDYIEYQAKKPPPSHSKDLHSIIVAAFNSIYAWLINHPWLVDDKGCLDAVLAVIELGISGTKSIKSKIANKTETPTLKGDKELKSVSLRVAGAAEALLALLMEHLGFFPNPCGPSSLTSLLDEESLFQKCSESSDKKFSYFAVDGSVILAILEDTINGADKTLPSAVAIMRGPTGKRVCLMQLRQFARSKQDMISTCKREASRPLPTDETLLDPVISQQNFPPEVSRVVKTKADLSIPTIDSIITDNQRNYQNNMATFMRLQRDQEEISVAERRKNVCSLEDQESDDFQKQPPIVSKLRATRLFLSHLGLLKIENLQSADVQYPGLISLDSSNTKLLKRLQALDAFPIRTYDTMLVFFVKKGQYSAKDISANEIPSLDNQLFMEFLQSLGWPVNLATHTGWNGDVSTSWKVKSRLTEAQQLSHNKRMFYYADLMTELAIHIPALNLKPTIVNTATTATTASSLVVPSTPTGSEVSSPVEVSPNEPILPPAVDSTEAEKRGRRLRKQGTVDYPSAHDIKHKINNSQSETKVVVAWLQDFNDHETFPALDLVELCDPEEYSYSAGHTVVGRVPDKEVVVIYIHPLKTGLFRIMVATVFGSSVGGPLVEGMVCSRRVLGSMVRKTAINVCRRRRLEIDSYSPPHVCRKFRIQDIIRNSESSKISEFYASLMEEGS